MVYFKKLNHRVRLLFALGLSACLCAPEVRAQTASVSLSGVQSPNPVVMGGRLTLTYTIVNNGPSTANSIILSNRLPASAIFTSASVLNGSWSVVNGVFYAYYTNVLKSATVRPRIVLTPVSAGTITNSPSAQAIVNGVAGTVSYAFLFTQVNPVVAGANMKLGRQLHSSTLLADGRVLITGGWNGLNSSTTTAKAEIYDPAVELFAFTGDLSSPRYNHTVNLLPDGGVLVVGGNTGTTETNSIELYYPTNGIFRLTNSLSQNRSGHTATLLSDGRLILAGGVSASTAIEIYNATNGTLSNGGDLTTTRAGQCAVLLKDGKILFAGGTTADPTSAEVYDPATLTSTAVGSMHAGRTAPRAALLSNGKVLVYEQSNAELYDPDTQTFSNVMNTSAAQNDGTIVLLNDGRVMISGGGSQIGYVPSVEVYDPATSGFSNSFNMIQARIGHAATLLKDGRILITGGFAGSVTATSETYAFHADADGDGMPDDWELANGFDPSNRNDALQDADGDGLTNLQEYLAGTDPHDPNSNMRITTVQLTTSTFRISFTTILNKLYRVESAPDPLSNSWQTLTNNILGTGAIMQVTDNVVAGQSRVYRVKLLR